MKKFNSVIAGLVFASLMVFLMVEGAEAFCVYNKTDTVIHVDQMGGRERTHGFSSKIKQGEKACCNWQNSDCNKEGKKDSIVRVNVYYFGSFRNKDICYNFPIKAGGWLTVEGSNTNYKCVAHDPTGPTPMPVPKPK